MTGHLWYDHRLEVVSGLRRGVLKIVLKELRLRMLDILGWSNPPKRSSARR
jgi:hypothetical protein